MQISITEIGLSMLRLNTKTILGQYRFLMTNIAYNVPIVERYVSPFYNQYFQCKANNSTILAFHRNYSNVKPKFPQ